MTLELRNVTKRTPGRNPITLRGVNLRVERSDRVAFLGHGNSGLKGILDVISGFDAPNEGKVVCTSRLSWALPNASFLHRHLSFTAAARFVGQLYQVEKESHYIAKVLEMAGIEDMAKERVSSCPKGIIGQFGFALGACLPFDIYLLTSTNIGTRETRQKYQDMIVQLGKRSGLILATSKAEMARGICDKAFVFDGQTAVYYDKIDAAIAALERLAAKRPAQIEDDEEEEEQEQERRKDEDEMF